MKKVAILQSNYIPWKGYFDLINMVDEFVLFDEAQYTKNDWRNRNKIKTKQGIQWITIPSENGHLEKKISEIEIKQTNWNIKHLKIIKQNYNKTKFFKMYEKDFENLYMNNIEINLSKINYNFIIAICKILDIKTKISFSKDFDLVEGQNEKLIGICKGANADIYLSGPAAKDYISEEQFKSNGIKVEWMNYNGYPEYFQPFGEFEHGVTILDLIFNCGPEASKYMLSFSK